MTAILLGLLTVSVLLVVSHKRMPQDWLLGLGALILVLSTIAFLSTLLVSWWQG